MAEFNHRQQIAEAKTACSSLRAQYLQKHGWVQTCNTPGSYWLWRRDFAVEDAARHTRWKERGPGPLGWPSEPQPYGVITTNEEIAVSMTERELDDDIDQDGDPDTPAITASDVAEFE